MEDKQRVGLLALARPKERDARGFEKWRSCIGWGARGQAARASWAWYDGRA